MDTGFAVNLGDNMASFNRGNLLNGDGDINAVFGGMFSAGSFDGFGLYLGKSDNMGGSIISVAPGFSLGFSIGLTFDNNMAAVFVNNGCAPDFKKRKISNLVKLN